MDEDLEQIKAKQRTGRWRRRDGERRDNSAPTHPWALGRGADWGYHAPVAEPLVAATRRTTVILGEIPCRQNPFHRGPPTFLNFHKTRLFSRGFARTVR